MALDPLTGLGIISCGLSGTPLWQSRRDAGVAIIEEFRKELRDHSASVQAKHEENLRALGEVKAIAIETGTKVVALGTRVESLEKLKPDLEISIRATRQHEERKRLWRRTWNTVVAVLVTLSGLVPLLSWLLHLRISIHDGGL